MLKRVSVALISIVMILVLCACDSEEVKQAKESYASGDFSKAVELLSEEEDLSQDNQDLLIEAEANVLSEEGKCFEAVKKLVSSSKGTEEEQFEEMYKAALDESIANHSTDNVIELLSMDETKTDLVYKKITKACKDKDYNGFIILDGLVEKLDDGDLKTKLSEFDADNDLLRAEAFIVGTWEWQIEGDKDLSKVEVIPYENNFVGRLIKIGDFLDGYHYEKDDIYWKDFQFESKDRFMCYNLTRYDDGDVAGETASGKIDYKKGVIELNVTGANNPIRTWKRID